MRATYRGGAASHGGEVGSGDPDVVRHQQWPGTDCTRADRWVRHRRSAVGAEAGEGPSPHVGKRPVGAVVKTRDRQYGPRPDAELFSGSGRVEHGCTAKRHERDDVDDADPRVYPSMGAQINEFDCSFGELSGCSFTYEREHRAVVMSIDVQVEQIVTHRGCERVQDGLISALGDIDDAFEHAKASQVGTGGGMILL